MTERCGACVSSLVKPQNAEPFLTPSAKSPYHSPVPTMVVCIYIYTHRYTCYMHAYIHTYISTVYTYVYIYIYGMICDICCFCRERPSSAFLRTGPGGHVEALGGEGGGEFFYLQSTGSFFCRFGIQGLEFGIQSLSDPFTKGSRFLWIAAVWARPAFFRFVHRKEICSVEEAEVLCLSAEKGLKRLILNAARRPPRPGRMLGGKHDARSGAFAFAGYRGAASTG